jgi:hypothetical protein
MKRIPWNENERILEVEARILERIFDISLT